MTCGKNVTIGTINKNNHSRCSVSDVTVFCSLFRSTLRHPPLPSLATPSYKIKCPNPIICLEALACQPEHLAPHCLLSPRLNPMPFSSSPLPPSAASMIIAYDYGEKVDKNKG